MHLGGSAYQLLFVCFFFFFPNGFSVDFLTRCERGPSVSNIDKLIVTVPLFPLLHSVGHIGGRPFTKSLEKRKKKTNKQHELGGNHAQFVCVREIMLSWLLFSLDVSVVRSCLSTCTKLIHSSTLKVNMPVIQFQSVRVFK